MGKIAAALDRALAARTVTGSSESIASTRLAAGDGWAVSDVICTAGPHDRAFEERHLGVSIGVVAAGTFEYRSSRGRAMLTPGSLLLGNDGECYECGHEHAAGDRCVAFRYEPAFFERIAADAGARSADRPLRSPVLPPLRALAPYVVRAAAGVAHAAEPAWEELAVELAGATVRASGGDLRRNAPMPPSRVVARVTESVRRIAADPDTDASLARLAAEARLSPWHYLRAFRRLTGVTPHQLVLRARLRAAAERLLAGDAKVIDVALASGFGDLSNFNRAFRDEFGAAPRRYRRTAGRR